jgi:eukaryotic-like serine/threonine-protein kinase
VSDPLTRLAAAFASHYTIERELGRGGMATVYLARDLKHNRRVALKVLRPELTLALGPDRFLREIEIAAQFAHPHIVPVFDSGEAGGFLYYVMPHVVGESLRSRLLRDGPLPVEHAVQIASEVANGLAYAHGQGIVHRDIKPENILLADGHAVVADFGIARAISAASSTHDDTATVAGLVFGTPLYMSPEQSAGHSGLDGRADIYSLGCVLYEMLAGEPPFVGPNAQAVTTQHAQDSPPALRARRPGLPAQLEQVVIKAMHKLPADRFASAGEFESALPNYKTPPEAQVPTVPSPAFRHSRHISRAGWALIGALTLAGALTATAFHRRSPPALDESLFIVLPFRHRAQSAPVLLTGDQCESLLHDALGRWEGVQMVDPLWVADARSRRGGAGLVKDAVALARERRAGRVVLGEVWQFQDTIHVRGLLYDAAGEKVVREQSVRIAPDLSDAQARFEELADSLLIGGGLAVGTPPRGGGKLSLPAWRAFQDGYAALQRWDLDSAKTRLRRALAIDPSYAMAQLWLAQVLAWSGDAPESWRSFAAGALVSGDSLAIRDRSIAEGLLALAEHRYPDACEHFRTLLARDSLDFAAWFGLGDCQGRDPVVLRDSISPSGWRFRGSYHAAVQSYRRALEVLPSVHLAFRGTAFSRLPELLYTESNQIRQGFAVASDTLRFGAFPSMSGDTLEFIPRPLEDVLAGKPEAVPSTIGAAISHNQEIWREIASSWVRAFPNSADAHETLALVLETTSELSAGHSSDPSALGEIELARRSAVGQQALRLANAETRILLKSGQMKAARLLADSLLRTNPDPSPEEAEQLRGIAALTGRIHLAARFQRLAAQDFSFRAWDGKAVTVPPELADAGLALLAYASFAAPIDSVVMLQGRIERMIPSYIQPRLRQRTREAMLDVPSVLTFPERGIGPTHRAVVPSIYLMEMQWALAHGDSARVRSQFSELHQLRRYDRPGDVAFDGSFHEARLLLALGDTAEATHLLDLSLDALPTLGSYLLDQLPQIATLVRGMALRADLAVRDGDRKNARRWSDAVTVLWSNCDPELQPVLDRMRRISSANR